MKELSIEEKARKYDEAIGRANEMIKAMTNIGGVAKVDDIQYLFPELKESEDERIRKELIAFLKYYHTGQGNCVVYDDDWIAWLEKQGEQPKKHDVCDNCDQQGCCVSPCPMKLVEKQGEQKPVEDKIWSIYDAKDGDVLNSVRVQVTIIFKGFADDDKHILAYCGLQKGIFISQEILWDRDFEPASEYWKNALYDAMTARGYEWDAEKKELKKIEQKLAWSEEDEKHYQGCLNLMKLSLDTKPYPYYNDYLWLKSLKKRVQLQPKQEWSEEDERTYKSITYSFANNYPLTVQQQEFVKSLKDRYTWKPSDEQLCALEHATMYNTLNVNDAANLATLYNDLKKLREE